MNGCSTSRFCGALALCIFAAASLATQDEPAGIKLPPPVTQGPKSVEQALDERRSQRRFAPTPLSLADIGQVLWAAQGFTNGDGYRTAPSAGALYPLELFIVVGNVTGLATGIYHYEPLGHSISGLATGDHRERVAAAALNQQWIADAPAVLVVTAVPARTAAKYSERAERYVAIETGHAAQNVYLQCVARGLGTAVVGAFDDDELAATLDLPVGHQVLAVMPIGFPRGN